MPRHDLRLLAFDGGGVRGLSSLMILQQLMETISPGSKPCDYFDMIGGTSTGGLVAIMLGRLRMSIDECIDAYLSLSDRIFQKKRHRVTIKGNIQGRFDSEELERAVKEVVTAQGLSEDTLLKDESDDACKVFVCATSKQTSENRCLTSYKSPRGGGNLLNSVTIWEACRATSAASSFFDSIAIGPFDEEFVDGATGANNPVWEVWDQAQLVWGPIEDKVQCLVSIGTGVPSLKPFRDDLSHIGETLIAIATETEQTAERFQRDKTHLDNIGRYYRFNVSRGLEEIGLEESKKRREIAAATRRYVESQEVYKKMQECANNVSGREYLGEYRTIFNLEGVPKAKTFVSRSTEIEKLEHALLPQRQSCRQKVFILYGLGGIGKTQLAVEFARLHRDSFSSVFWLDGRNEASLKRSFASCASRIPEGQISETSRTHYADGNGDLDRVVKEVMNWLRQPRNTDWLLVIDNVDGEHDLRNEDTYDVKHYLSGADHGAVLITTRLAQLEQLGDSQHLGRVTRDQAKAILKVWYEKECDTVEAQRLLHRLDDLPLAIAQAGAYLQQTRVGLGKYLEFYEQQWKELMELNDEDGALLQDYPDRSVCTTWTISYNTIRKKDQNAANLLMLWASLDNRDLWYDLFASACSRSTAAARELSAWIGDIASKELQFNEAMKLLRNYSLVEGMENSMGYATHPVVHRWAHYLPGEICRKDLAQLAMVVIGYAVPRLASRDSSTMQRRLLPHAEVCSRWVLTGEMEQNPKTRSPDQADFDRPRRKNTIILHAVARLGSLYNDQGKLAEAEKIYTAALRGYEASGTKNGSQVATVEALGNTYAAQGKYPEAQKLIRRALQGKEELLGIKHISAVHNLGLLYRRQGNLADAEQMYKRVLKGSEASDSDHIPRLVTIKSLGIVYVLQDKLAEAEEMLDQALQGFQNALGAEHTYTLTVVAELGRLYLRQGKLTKAEENLDWALRRLEEALGTEHKTTLDAVLDLGVLYAKQGKVADAEKMFGRALRGYKEALGADHPTTLIAVNNLGDLYAKQDKWVQAEEMYQRALRGFEEALGAEHKTTLDAVLDLGVFYAKQDKWVKAEEMYQRAIRGHEEALGAEHKTTLDAVLDLGDLYAKQDKWVKAEEMYQRAIRGYEEAKGAKHKTTLDAVLNLGVIYAKQGELAEAEKMFGRALRGYKEALGADHPATLRAVHNLRLLAIDSDQRGG